MASSRYGSKRTFKNSTDHYVELFKERANSKNLVQYETSVSEPLPPALKKSLFEVQHTWQTGDKYWKLAARHYGNGRYWWVIAKYNNRPTEAHVSAGTILNIPLPLDKILRYYK